MAQFFPATRGFFFRVTPGGGGGGGGGETLPAGVTAIGGGYLVSFPYSVTISAPQDPIVVGAAYVLLALSPTVV